MRPRRRRPRERTAAPLRTGWGCDKLSRRLKPTGASRQGKMATWTMWAAWVESFRKCRGFPAAGDVKMVVIKILKLNIEIGNPKSETNSKGRNRTIGKPVGPALPRRP